MKQCTKCKDFKSLNEYQKRSASSDGLTARCKGCLSGYDKSRANTPSRIKARAEYAKTEAGINSANLARKKWAKNNKDKIYQSTKKYREDNKIKAYAHGVVSYGIKLKVIKRGSCEICGDKQTHGHHDDYSKPMEVRWLCSKHHNQWHAENGEGLNG